MLEKDNIRLGAIEPEDIDFILEMENNSDLWHLSNTHNPFSRFDIEQYVMLADKDVFSAKQLRLLIIDRKTEIRIGIIDIFDFDAYNKRAGVGVLIVENQRNKGVASTAMDILIEYAFQQLNIHQLYCNINIDNKKSINLFEKKGFIRTGLKKDWNIINNRFVDVCLYQLINENQ